jgi:MoaA/NifB/PqqE/SkfB family radical SAM enzyme
VSKNSDSNRILKHLNFKRVLNLVGLKWSYWFSRVTKRPSQLGLPFSLSIEPTTACNLGCPECPSGLKQFTRPTGKLDLDFQEKLLQQVSKTVFYINYYFQGEPFLQPQFLELIKQAKKHKIYTATSTKAHFINARFISLSLKKNNFFSLSLRQNYQ